MQIWKFLLKQQSKRFKYRWTNSGFTMIELMVAMTMAFLIVTPLLGLVISIMTTDRQEQAKLNSQQEIQVALDYIERDLKQAVYIYDADGIDKIKNQIPTSSTDRVPVLVFWKREFVEDIVTATDNTKDDTFVLSLVVYYLIKDSSSTWSDAARIARWQIRDGVGDSAVVCTSSLTGDAARKCRSPGFANVELSDPGTLEERMNKWEKATGETYTANATELVDFVDQTKNTDTTELPTAICPSTTSTTITWSKVAPAIFDTRATGKMTGFYACIDRSNFTAQVYIRGNALARLDGDTNNIKYSDARKNYFPTANIRVQGRGFLY